MKRARNLLAGYPELAAVLVAAILGLSVQRPLAWITARQGINVLLAVLVFATAVTIEPTALRRLAVAWRPLLAALAVGVTVPPACSRGPSSGWSAAGPLRDGVMAVGLAPCKIASVATTAMAGGEAALAAGVLIGSTFTSVAFAGPVLTLEAGHGAVTRRHHRQPRPRWWRCRLPWASRCAPGFSTVPLARRPPAPSPPPARSGDRLAPPPCSPSPRWSR